MALGQRSCLDIFIGLVPLLITAAMKVHTNQSSFTSYVASVEPARVPPRTY